MKLIIAGSRHLKPAEAHITRAIMTMESYMGQEVSEVVCGMAKGVDMEGFAWAKGRGIPVKEFPADWEKGRGAGLERNWQMGEYADALLAFWDGKSPGTQHMINTMYKKGKPLVVFSAGQREHRGAEEQS